MDQVSRNGGLGPSLAHGLWRRVLDGLLSVASIAYAVGQTGIRRVFSSSQRMDSLVVRAPPKPLVNPTAQQRSRRLPCDGFDKSQVDDRMAGFAWNLMNEL
jgi:hypothetical protein